MSESAYINHGKSALSINCILMVEQAGWQELFKMRLFIVISIIFTNFILTSQCELQKRQTVTNVTFGQRTFEGKLSPVFVSLHKSTVSLH